jgi:hypothetical protein
MFFDHPWWTTDVGQPPKYPAEVNGYNVTREVLEDLKKAHFPESYRTAIKENPNIYYTTVTPAEDFIELVEETIKADLDYKQRETLLNAAFRTTIGPTTTDLPIRQVVYFGNNAPDKQVRDGDCPVYGILGSYDDERFDDFWKELEFGPDETKEIPESSDTQPLQGPRDAPAVMVKMLRKQLALVHFGPDADYSAVPEPLETKFMDWSLPPFSAGYHAYAAHYNISDVQQKIRKPTQLIDGADANIFIVGETYSNDQAWVEGAFCTAESVLNDFFGVEPIIDNKAYPFICPCENDCTQD